MGRGRIVMSEQGLITLAHFVFINHVLNRDVLGSRFNQRLLFYVRKAILIRAGFLRNFV